VSRTVIASWLQRIFRGRDRFNAVAASDRIPKVTIRQVSTSDLKACWEIYALNAPGRFPDGYFEVFKETLQSPSYLYLVVESSGAVVGVGGIYRNQELACCCSLLFGAIHPDHHRQGYGSALLLARLAALPKPDSWERILLSTVGDSAQFYKRFGFTFYDRFQLPPNQDPFDCYYSILRSSDWSGCVEVLEKSGVSFAREGLSVPTGPATPNHTMQPTAESGS
jgi:ribosomal protein S18 acetylase RimI-like enzyme